MGQLPVLKRFLTEDFKDQAGWINALLTPLNLLLVTVYSNLNNGLTLSQNVFSQVTTLSVSGASPSVSFPYKYSPKVPIGVSVINVVQTNSPAVALTAAVGCLFTSAAGVITATLQGLDSGSTYNVTFVAWGG